MPYSFALTLFYPCESHFDFNMITCGAPCYINEQIVAITHWMLAIMVPVLIIVISHVLTFLKLYQQKSELLRQNRWKKKSRMLRQLFSITGLLSIAWVPFSLLCAIDVISLPSAFLKQCIKWALFVCVYLSILCSPIISMIVLPNIKHELFIWIQERRGIVNNRINPITTVASGHN